MTPAEITAKEYTASSVVYSMEALTATSVQIASRIQTYYIYLQSILAMQYVSTEVAVILLLSNVSLWLEALYLDLLEQVSHVANKNIGYYYDLMIIKFEQIGQFSEAIGQPACFVQNALRNARGIALNSYASLGRRYLVAELDWLQDRQIILQTLAANSDLYLKQPSALFADLDYLVTQSAIDAQADNQLFMTNLIQQLGYVIHKQQEQITEFDYKYWLLEDNMSNALAQGIENVFSIVDEKFKQWEQNIYEPQIEAIQDQLMIQSDKLDSISEQLAVVIEQISLPGDLLAAAMELREPVRTEQLMKISDTVLEPYALNMFTWAALIEEKTK